MANVGDKFPNATLEGTMKGEKSSYEVGGPSGKHRVFIFFPFAFTPV